MTNKPSLVKELEIIPEFSQHNLIKFRAISKIYFDRMSAFHASKDIIEVLLTKLDDENFVLASEQQIVTWETFENFITLLASSNLTPEIAIEEIFNLRQLHRESLIEYLHRVEKVSSEYKLSVQVANQKPLFTDVALNVFISQNAARGLKAIYRSQLIDQIEEFTMQKFREFCMNPGNDLFSHLNANTIDSADEDSMSE